MVNILAATVKMGEQFEYSCGNLDATFAGTFPYVTHLVVQVIKIAIPILLIIFGMLDLGKAVVAAKEDEIKKGQQTFIKRLVAAIIVFFVSLVVQIVVKFAASKDDPTIMNCMNCFINGEVKDTACIER